MADTEELWNEFQRLYMADTAFYVELTVKSVPKGRPRVGRHSIYTPKRTRDFEKLIREAAETVQRGQFTCPVRVIIELTERVPKSYKGAKRAAAEAGLITPPVGDLDNRVKAITDAMNGVAYLDDKQITYLRAQKQFGDSNKVVVTIERAGLSDWEIEKLNDNRQ